METTIQYWIKKFTTEPLKLLEAIGGYYETVKDSKGNRLTPLVGYPCKYDAGHGIELQYVGEVCEDLTKAEEHPDVMFHLTKMLYFKIKYIGPAVFVGPHMGGMSAAQFLAYHSSQFTDARYACAERIFTQLNSRTTSEHSELRFTNHTINERENVFIVEDVLSDFSTTKLVIELVESYGATVKAIVGLFNKSMTVDSSYLYNDRLIPVYSLIRQPYAVYKQDDHWVIDDIKKGNVVLDPKNEWHVLKRAVELSK